MYYSFWVVARRVKVIPSSSTYIRCIESKYTREEVDWRKEAPVVTCLTVDVDSMPIEKCFPTLAFKPSGTSAPKVSS